LFLTRQDLSSQFVSLHFFFVADLVSPVAAPGLSSPVTALGCRRTVPRLSSARAQGALLATRLPLSFHFSARAGARVFPSCSSFFIPAHHRHQFGFAARIYGYLVSQSSLDFAAASPPCFGFSQAEFFPSPFWLPAYDFVVRL
jgi:hypothetical protein